MIRHRSPNDRTSVCLLAPSPICAGSVLSVAMMTTAPASADPLKDDIAPTGKLRVAIAISPAGGAFWSTKTEAGYAGVPVDLGKAMAEQLGVPVAYVAYQNSDRSPTPRRAGNGTWPSCPRTPSGPQRCRSGPSMKWRMRPTSSKRVRRWRISSSSTSPVSRWAAVNNTTTMRGAVAHLKNAQVTRYQTYDDIFQLLKSGTVDAFALSRDQLNAMARKIPGTRVLHETFKQTVTAVAVPLNHPQALAFATKFMTDATSNGELRRAYDANGPERIADPDHGNELSDRRRNSRRGTHDVSIAGCLPGRVSRTNGRRRRRLRACA